MSRPKVDKDWPEHLLKGEKVSEQETPETETEEEPPLPEAEPDEEETDDE